MTIKLEEGINNLRIRMVKKAETNTYILKLKNKNTKYESEFNIVDLSVLTMFGNFIVDLGQIEYGEYIYTITDTNNIIYRDGTAYYRIDDETIPTYNENNTYISYGQ
jgi:hypothetical protein